MSKHLRAKVFKRTDDDWYGNHRLANSTRVFDYAKRAFVGSNLVETGRLVEVSLLSLPIPGGGAMSDTDTRVCVWGNDDFGMEKDFDNREDATATFLFVISQEVVNQKWLEDNRFIRS